MGTAYDEVNTSTAVVVHDMAWVLSSSSIAGSRAPPEVLEVFVLFPCCCCNRRRRAVAASVTASVEVTEVLVPLELFPSLGIHCISRNDSTRYLRRNTARRDAPVESRFTSSVPRSSFWAHNVLRGLWPKSRSTT